jgi:hypothetical protein
LVGSDKTLQALVNAAAGGTASSIMGGKFANGASTAAFSYVVRATPDVYERVVGFEIDIGPGGDAQEKGRMTPPIKGANNIGVQGGGLNPSCMFCEGGHLSRMLNRIPGVNAVAGLHDVMQINTPGIWREFTNVPYMVPAAIATYSGALGSLLNAIPGRVHIPLGRQPRDEQNRGKNAVSVYSF